VITDAIVAVLNQMLRADPGATHALIANRIPCNATLAAHPAVQVEARGDLFSVGMLGVLNGVAAAEDGLVVVVADSDSGLIAHFERRVAP
jgi:hypothetical protein